MSALHPVIAQALSPFMPPKVRPPRTTSSDVCRSMRECSPMSHEDSVRILTNLSAEILKPCALTDKCTASVIDRLDSVVDVIEQDKVNQEIEA